jgi:predicted SAM-dependent methyltransferase
VRSYVNLGCGTRYHSDWINIDISSHGPGVIQHDLSQGIPLPDGSCDVVYHAAVLEHMRRDAALSLLHECHRVLKPGGITRVGVPDLERLCSLYLTKLQAACDGDEAAEHDYAWIMLELYDQAARETSGGEMLDFLRQVPLPNEAFVYERIGEEGRQLVNALRHQEERRMAAPVTRQPIGIGLSRRIGALVGSIRRHLLQLLLGPGGTRALDIGRFRLSGEVHHWMYDRYSLGQLLRAAGFHNPVLLSASRSQIPDWTSFHLDTLPDGSIVKPDLLFMEARKGSDD